MHKVVHTKTKYLKRDILRVCKRISKKRKEIKVKFEAEDITAKEALWLGARWAYLKVIAIVLCPRSSLTVVRSTPSITKGLAKVCRKSWKRKSFMPARIQALANDLLPS